jgi:hypothetical protein
LAQIDLTLVISIVPRNYKATNTQGDLLKLITIATHKKDFSSDELRKVGQAFFESVKLISLISIEGNVTNL